MAAATPTAADLAVPGYCCGCGHDNARGCGCCPFLWLRLWIRLWLRLRLRLFPRLRLQLRLWLWLPGLQVAWGEHGWVQVVFSRLL